MIDAEEFLRMHPVDADSVSSESDGNAGKGTDVGMDADSVVSHTPGDNASLERQHSGDDDYDGMDPFGTQRRGSKAHDRRHIGSFGVRDGEGEGGSTRRHARRTSRRGAGHYHGSSAGSRSRMRRPGGFGSPSVGALHGSDGNSTTAGVVSADMDKDQEDMLEACRQSALTLLDAAPRSTGMLRDRLLSKGFTPDVVDEIIERLTRVALIDDEAYARSVIRYCVGRMYGERGVLRELQRKKVDRSIAEPLVRDAHGQGVFTDAAWELGRRVAEKTVGLDDVIRKRRLWSAGGRRGHDAQTLREIQQTLFDGQKERE